MGRSIALQEVKPFNVNHSNSVLCLSYLSSDDRLTNSSRTSVWFKPWAKSMSGTGSLHQTDQWWHCWNFWKCCEQSSVSMAKFTVLQWVLKINFCWSHHANLNIYSPSQANGVRHQYPFTACCKISQWSTLSRPQLSLQILWLSNSWELKYGTCCDFTAPSPNMTNQLFKSNP